MENFDVFCVQFVVQSIERIRNDDSKNAMIENICLKFGEQTVVIESKPIVFETNQKYVNIKKGKICFCEKDQLGFEIILKLQKGYASNEISFISFEDKKNRSTLQASIPLKNAFNKTIFVINFISSRHLLKNLGRQIETESIGIQTSPRLRNALSQTSTILKSNAGTQVSKKHQRNVWTLNAIENKDASTQTDLSQIVSAAEERKALLRLIVLLVCKVSSRISGNSRIRPIQQQQPQPVAAVEEVIPPEPEVGLKEAQDFSNLRKRQIEQMRERLHLMAEERREILQLTNAKHPIDPGKKINQVKDSGGQPIAIRKPDISAFLKPSNQVAVPREPVVTIPASIPSAPSTSNVQSHFHQQPHPSFEFSTEKERIVLSPRISLPDSPKGSPLNVITESSPPPNFDSLTPKHSPLPFSRQESIISSLHSEADDPPLDELPSPAQSGQQSPIPITRIRRKSFTLAEASQDSTKSLSIGNFLEPTIFVPQPPKKHVTINESIKDAQKEATLDVTNENVAETESSASSSSTPASSTASESSGASETSQTKKHSEEDSDTTEASSSSSSASTLKEKSKASSSSSSTLGEGSISTEESIQEEIPEAIESDIESVKNASSISEASSFSRQSIELSPTSKYLSREGKTRRKSFAKKPLNTDSISSYAPSD